MSSNRANQIPARCTVLIIGGGPAGSYAAAALAMESIDVVLLEADRFPRYHIGESMIPAMRFLLKYINADTKFVEHGFTRKNGSAFKLTVHKREGYTNFLDVGGPENFTWNVLRSEADEILFRHAEECGAKVFDGVKVTSISFDGDDQSSSRPIRASYIRKSDARSGEVGFDYVIDASGRSGILSTKYLKNRVYNKSLNNIASWAYWKDTGKYAPGTSRENSPYFEALTDESGWAWFIPLHIGTSVGIVMDKAILGVKKRSQSVASSAEQFYLEQLKLAPTIQSLIGTGTLITPADGTPTIKTGIDASYSARSYAAEGFRICGDAGAFIDPYFSTGVHLALVGGLSAAVSICAALRGDCSENDAAKWHSDRIASSYTWFLMVVLGAYKQMRAQSKPVLSGIDEDNFDLAFSDIRLVIQGSMDIEGKSMDVELSKTLDLCSRIFGFSHPEDRESMLEKLQNLPAPEESLGLSSSSGKTPSELSEVSTGIISENEKSALDYIQARKLLRTSSTLNNIESFTSNVVNGMVPRLQHGQLGLNIV